MKHYKKSVIKISVLYFTFNRGRGKRIHPPSVSVLIVFKALNVSVALVRQKVESQSGDNKKAKHTKFSEKRTFLAP